MKLTKVLSVSTLSLFLGASALMYAQEEKPKDESRPEATKDEKTKDEKARPAPDKGAMGKPQENRDQTGKMPEQTEDKTTRGDDRAAHQQDNSTQMQHGAQGNNAGQSTAQAHGGNRGGGRIPDDKFRSSFGRQHAFVVSRPTVVGGQPQFVYGGYTFNMINAWPGDWSYSDQVYVDYVDGQYFLYDLAHPGVTVAIVVVM
jgi:hypothetical protein